MFIPFLTIYKHYHSCSLCVSYVYIVIMISVPYVFINTQGTHKVHLRYTQGIHKVLLWTPSNNIRGAGLSQSISGFVR